MLLIYILEGRVEWQDRLLKLLAESKRRGDQLFTSYLALGEVMAGAKANQEQLIRKSLDEMNFVFLVYGREAVQPFAQLRSVYRVPVADSIHLACASAEGIDLFLTGDKALKRLHVPGIKFIGDTDSLL